MMPRKADDRAAPARARQGGSHRGGVGADERRRARGAEGRSSTGRRRRARPIASRSSALSTPTSRSTGRAAVGARVDQPAHEGLAAAIAASSFGARREQHLDDIRRTVEYGVEARHHVQRLSRGLVGRHDRLARLRDGAHRRARRAAGATHHGLRHARHPLPGAGARVRRAGSSRRFRDRHFDYHGHNDYGLGTANTLEAAHGRRARRPRHRERHGRAGRQRVARRGRGGAARSRGPAHARQRARAGRHQQAGRSVLGPARSP